MLSKREVIDDIDIMLYRFISFILEILLVDTYNRKINKYTNNEKKHKDKHTNTQACKGTGTIYIEGADNLSTGMADVNKVDNLNILDIAHKVDNKTNKIGRD